MVKHTQGEWGVATIDNGAADDEVVTIVNGCMVNIAAVFGTGEYSEARPDGENEPHYEVSKEEAAANARLIAAAPELFDACTALVEWCDKNPPAGEALYFVQMARAAIAKATGEQPCS